MKRFLVLAVLAALMSCQRAGLTANDLAGTWALAERSRQWLPTELQDVKASVVLNADGTFRASSFPEVNYYLKQRTGLQTITGEGTWRLAARSGHRGVELTFRSIQGVGALDFRTQLKVARRPLRLYYFEGDPDSGQRIEFERE